MEDVNLQNLDGKVPYQRVEESRRVPPLQTSYQITWVEEIKDFFIDFIPRSFCGVVWLRDFHRKLCESEITEKQITTKSSQGFQLKTAFSFQLPLLFLVRWHQWACDNCDRPETWLWLTKMHWTRLSIWATNRHLLKVRIEKRRNLSSVDFISWIFTVSTSNFTPISRPPRRSSLRSSSKIYSVSFQVSYFRFFSNFQEF